MSNRRMEFFIGMMVIGIVVGVFIMTVLFTSEKGIFVGGSGGQRMTIYFDKGSGIGQNSLVLKNGIKIGRVYSVKLIDDPEKPEVEVQFELNPGYTIYSNEYAKINRTLLGDASIEFVDDPTYGGEIYARTSEDHIKGVNSGDLMGTVSNIEGDLALALQNINKASEGVTLFMENVNTIFGDEHELELKKEKLQNIFTELEGALAAFRRLSDNVDAVVSDEEIVANIRRATAEAPAILAKITELTDGAQNFMNSANSLGDDVRQTLSRAETTFDLVDKNLDNVNVFTTSLAENGPEIMTSLNESAAEIRGTINNIKGAVLNIADLAENLNEKLDNPDSPLGMLTDPKTGESLRHIISNVEDLTEKMYPILDDARVFSNKIAHKPSSLIWDRTQSKGVTGVDSRYGMQSNSPNGGLTSQIFRMTPSGSKIRTRSYYQPAADEQYMDAQTRAAYNQQLERRRLALQDEQDFQYDAYQGVIPADYQGDLYADERADQYEGEYPEILPSAVKTETNKPRFFARFFGARTSEREQCARWSLESIWGRLWFNRRANAATVANDYDCYDEAPYDDYYAGEAQFVGYQEDPQIATSLAQPVYNDYGQAMQYDANGYAADYQQNVGVQPRAPYEPERVGAYRSIDEPTESFNNVDFSLRDDVVDIQEPEELPSSINRLANPNGAVNATNLDEWEDDGLPLELAPATR
ncbi:MAG: MlaD family protein [Planctomycetia bacterium]|nr:MlaD family protein [Planctomycetia bacterium]